MSDTDDARLEPIGREEAIELTRGEERDFIRDHPGQSYLVHRGAYSPKFRVICECGGCQLRWGTFFTAEKWMKLHVCGQDSK
jgi:hypothetical protein